MQLRWSGLSPTRWLGAAAPQRVVRGQCVPPDCVETATIQGSTADRRRRALVGLWSAGTKKGPVSKPGPVVCLVIRRAYFSSGLGETR